VSASPTAVPPAGHPRFPLLDVAGALAALSIVVLHVGEGTGFTAANPLGALTARLDVGVAVFFVLSGFLLYRPFAAARLERRPPPDPVRYLRRRALRILPAYWLVLVVAGAAGWAVVFTADWWRYFGLVHVYDRETALGGVVPAWTLAVEASFYLALPLWVALAGRLAGTSARRELAALGAVAAAVLAGRAVLGPQSASALTLVAFADWFALGMVLAVASARRGGPAGALRRGSAWAGWAVAAGAFLVAALALGLPRGFTAPGSDAAALAQHALYGAVGLALVAAAVTPGAARTLPGRVLGHPVARRLGLISYGVFLWHHPLLVGLLDTGIVDRVPVPFVTVLTLTLGASVVLAELTFRLVERPAMALGERPAPAVTPAAAPARASAG